LFSVAIYIICTSGRRCSLLTLLPCGTTEFMVIREICCTSGQLRKLLRLFSKHKTYGKFLL
jgi:hypothetical protein